VAVALQLDLARAVRASNARTLDRQDTSAEHDLAPLVAVSVGDALGVRLAPRADDVDDLLLHQLSEHAQADADREGEQALLRRPHELTERRLHRLRQLSPRRPRSGDDLDRL